MRLGIAAAAAAAACVSVGLGACGGTPGDLMAIDVAGGPDGISRTLVVTEDGRASCNRSPLHQLTSADLLEARSIVRDAKPLASSAQAFPPGRASDRRFVLRTKDGTARWTETSPGVPPVLPRAVLLALRLSRLAC